MVALRIFLGIPQSDLIWVNYNISLTWNKAFLGMLPLINHDSRARSQWGHLNDHFWSFFPSKGSGYPPFSWLRCRTSPSLWWRNIWPWACCCMSRCPAWRKSSLNKRKDPAYIRYHLDFILDPKVTLYTVYVDLEYIAYIYTHIYIYKYNANSGLITPLPRRSELYLVGNFLKPPLIISNSEP